MKRYILSLLVLSVSLTATAQTSDKETFARNHELAQLGDPTAMYNVGKGYFDGKGVAKDHGEAFKWFLKAAQMNNVSAIEMVAYMYGYGDGTDFDLLEQIYWDRKGAEMGSGYCMCDLGLYYVGFNGIFYGGSEFDEEIEDEKNVTEQFIDKKKGLDWLKKSARTGYKFAQGYLEGLKETW